MSQTIIDASESIRRFFAIIRKRDPIDQTSLEAYTAATGTVAGYCTVPERGALINSFGAVLADLKERILTVARRKRQWTQEDDNALDNAESVCVQIEDWQRAELAKQHEGDGKRNTPPAAGQSNANAVDPTVYRPASEFTDADRFPNLKAIRKALDKNPWIRHRRPIGKNGKPIPNRLGIHAGDWLKYRQQLQAADPLDQPGATVDAVLEVEKRKAEIDRATGRK